MKIVSRNRYEIFVITNRKGNKYHVYQDQDNSKYYTVYWNNDNDFVKGYLESFIKYYLDNGLWKKITSQEYYENIA